MGVFLVTGGAGFIGSHLADSLLADGHGVRVLDDYSTGKAGNLDRRCRAITGDVADQRTVRAAMEGTDGCFHLAAIASVARGNEDWCGTHRVNQGGTVAVLDAARAAGRLPVVYASSAAVYGEVLGARASEGLQPAPQTAYGADKLGSELHGRVAFVAHGVPTLGLRFFNVYGPRQDAASPYSGVISLFARRIADGGSVTLHGDGEQSRDFAFVADVVQHLRAGMDRLAAGPAGLAGEVLNVCTGRGTAVRRVAELLALGTGRPLTFSFGPPRVGDIRHSVGDPARAVAALSLRAQTPLEQGLGAVLDWLAGADAAQ